MVVNSIEKVKHEEKAVEFKSGDFVVYPTHGVGKIVDIETRVVSGHELSMYVIEFDDDRMTMRIPKNRALETGLRPVVTKNKLDDAVNRLKSRAKLRRAMWTRLAQEYESKINSGDPNAIAEVVRDLFRSPSQSEQSYSERQLYQSALSRLSKEMATVEKIDQQIAVTKLEQLLDSVN